MSTEFFTFPHDWHRETGHTNWYLIQIAIANLLPWPSGNCAELGSPLSPYIHSTWRIIKCRLFIADRSEQSGKRVRDMRVFIVLSGL